VPKRACVHSAAWRRRQEQTASAAETSGMIQAETGLAQAAHEVPGDIGWD